METRLTSRARGWKDFFRFLGSSCGVLAALTIVFPLATSVRDWFSHVPGYKMIAMGLATVASLFILPVAYSRRGTFYRALRASRVMRLPVSPVHLVAVPCFVVGALVATSYLGQFEYYIPYWNAAERAEWRFLYPYGDGELGAVVLFTLMFVLWTGAFLLGALEAHRQQIEASQWEKAKVGIRTAL